MIHVVKYENEKKNKRNKSRARSETYTCVFCLSLTTDSSPPSFLSAVKISTVSVLYADAATLPSL